MIFPCHGNCPQRKFCLPYIAVRFYHCHRTRCTAKDFFHFFSLNSWFIGAYANGLTAAVHEDVHLRVPCEQWFLQAGRCATKVEKPMRATVCFSIEHAQSRDAYVKTSNAITSSCFAGNVRDFKIQRSDGNENVKRNQV